MEERLKCQISPLVKYRQQWELTKELFQWYTLLAFLRLNIIIYKSVSIMIQNNTSYLI